MPAGTDGRPVETRWSTPSEAIRLALQPSQVRRSAVIALFVGTLLSAINQAHVIASGEADGSTWARVVANYVVPFLVSMAGALWAMKEPSGP